MRSVLVSAFILAACGHDPAPPAATPAPPTSATVRPASNAPIRVSGTRGGKAFSFECSDLVNEVGSEKSSAFYAEDSADIWLSCVDSASNLEANTHIKKPAVGTFKPDRDESGGRVGLVAKSADAMVVIKTSDVDGTGKGEVRVTAWEPAKRHVVGTSTMTWAKDASGASGSVKIDYDVTIPKK